MELTHFSHVHPLVLSNHEEQKDDGGEEVPCSGCLLPLSGSPTYNCIRCKYFLHKSCAELPDKILHFMHARHPLTLLANAPSDGDGSARCCACDNCGEQILGFTYKCSPCNFCLDIKCASLLDIIQAEGHKHSFMFLKPMIGQRGCIRNFCVCDACGEEIYDASYLCTTCQFLDHGSCNSVPPIIKLLCHPHQLNLSYFAPFGQDCKICLRSMLGNYCYYSCSICTTYTAHLGCANAKELRDEAFMLKAENQYETETNIGSIISKVAKELAHCFHPHPLILRDKEPECDKICDGCSWPICPPFYSCSQCDFNLHEACAELPPTIVHPLHQFHPLTLYSKKPDFHYRDQFQFDGRKFRCEGCSFISKGFTYSCENCRFNIDVKCGLFTETLKHKGHQHTLNFIQGGKRGDLECTGCGRYSEFKFNCGQGCNFGIELRVRGGGILILSPPRPRRVF